MVYDTAAFLRKLRWICRVIEEQESADMINDQNVQFLGSSKSASRSVLLSVSAMHIPINCIVCPYLPRVADFESCRGLVIAGLPSCRAGDALVALHH